MNDNLKTLLNLRLSLDAASDMSNDLYDFFENLLDNYEGTCEELGEIDFEYLITSIDAVITELDFAMYLINQLKKKVTLEEAIEIYNKMGVE